MRLYVRKKKLGEVFGSRVACRLDDKNAPEPDILFVAREESQTACTAAASKGRPTWPIEIVSPESVERDYDKKRRQYQRFKIPEYWIIDEHERKVTLLRLDARGKYREVARARGYSTARYSRAFGWTRTGSGRIRSLTNWRYTRNFLAINGRCEGSFAPRPTSCGVHCSGRAGSPVEPLPYRAVSSEVPSAVRK